MRVGEIMAYEISKTLQYKTVTVTTPLGKAKSHVLSPQPVITAVLRAGLPFQQGFLNYFDQADSAFIAAYRKHKSKQDFEIDSHYVGCPRMDGRPLIIVDPMLATGATIHTAMTQLSFYGTPTSLHIAAILASKKGAAEIISSYPKVNLWVSAIDPKLNAESYIVPGMGDAGDLAFGEKCQH